MPVKLLTSSLIPCKWNSSGGLKIYSFALNFLVIHLTMKVDACLENLTSIYTEKRNAITTY